MNRPAGRRPAAVAGRAARAMSPRLSVVLGVRDAADTVEATVRSVCAQRDVDLELVVVDDGSRDGSASAVAALARDDDRVRLLRQSAAGLTRALRTGCSEARGEYIARIDAGDRMLPGRLALQLEILERLPDVAVLGSLVRMLGPAGEPLYLTGTVREGALVDLTTAFTAGRGEGLGGIAHPSVCFRRDAYRAAGGYRAAFALAQDVDLWARMAQHGRIARVEQVLTEMGVGLDRLSARHHKAQLALRELAARSANTRRMGGNDSAQLARAEQVSRSALGDPAGRGAGAYFVASCLARRGDLDAADAYFRMAIDRDPAHLRSLVGLARTRIRRGLAGLGARLGIAL